MPSPSNNQQSSPEPGAETIRTPLGPYMRLLLQIFGIILVPIGVAGVILPVLPGVPLLILAAACFARSSPRLERWLVTHPKFGPDIVAWRERGAIPLRAKILAVTMIAFSVFMIVQSPAPIFVKIIVISCVTSAALFVSTRPNA